MRMKQKWTITTGYDQGKAYLDLWASGDRLTEPRNERRETTDDGTN
jgi:hypothetical protein